MIEIFKTSGLIQENMLGQWRHLSDVDTLFFPAAKMSYISTICIVNMLYTNRKTEPQSDHRQK